MTLWEASIQPIYGMKKSAPKPLGVKKDKRCHLVLSKEGPVAFVKQCGDQQCALLRTHLLKRVLVPVDGVARDLEVVCSLSLIHTGDRVDVRYGGVPRQPIPREKFVDRGHS